MSESFLDFFSLDLCCVSLPQPEELCLGLDHPLCLGSAVHTPAERIWGSCCSQQLRVVC